MLRKNFCGFWLFYFMHKYQGADLGKKANLSFGYSLVLFYVKTEKLIFLKTHFVHNAQNATLCFV